MSSKFQRLLVICGILAWCVPAHAYIDPGTGSALIGALVAAFAAIVASVKLYWHRLIGLFTRKSTEDNTAQPNIEAEEK